MQSNTDYQYWKMKYDLNKFALFFVFNSNKSISFNNIFFNDTTSVVDSDWFILDLPLLKRLSAFDNNVSCNICHLYIFLFYCFEKVIYIWRIARRAGCTNFFSIAQLLFIIRNMIFFTSYNTHVVLMNNYCLTYIPCWKRKQQIFSQNSLAYTKGFLEDIWSFRFPTRYIGQTIINHQYYTSVITGLKKIIYFW